jgi:ubiquinone/menaquinone biosynthesis C-methylase UbiE
MKLNKFNRVATYYDLLAQLVFGNAIRNSQTLYLNQLPKDSKILVIGGGTGWWLKELQRINPICEVWFIEASSAMLERARMNGSSNITFIHGTEGDIPPIQFDGIVTYYFLDLFTDLEMKVAIERLNACLKSNGIWAVADFVNYKWWHRTFLSVMYFFFRRVGALRVNQLHRWEENLTNQNLERTHQTFFYKGFITSCLYRKIHKR